MKVFIEKDGRMIANPALIKQGVVDYDADGDVTCTRCGMEKALIVDPEHGALCAGCVQEIPENLGM